MFISSVLQITLRTLLVSTGLYAGFLCLLTIPALQSQVIYLHGVVLTWFQDVNFPEQWGFLPNQVTPFLLPTADGETLHAWHILPLGLYQKHEADLTAEPAGLAPSITDRLSFKLLRDDPQSLLVLYLHGAAGTLGSGWRPPSYRAMSALAPERIHTVAIDYRGFGTSTGQPNEEGLLLDALALVEWAINEARVPPERIVVFAQSIGTAVAISLARHLAAQDKPLFFNGMVLVAPFADLDQLTQTYRVAGTVPLLSPLAMWPALHRYLKTFLICRWPSRELLGEFVSTVEAKDARYDVTIIHAKDDWDIPWSHSETLFWDAVGATVSEDEKADEVRQRMMTQRKPLGASGWRIQRETQHGVLRQEIVEYGLHDRVMSYPIVSLAVWRAFHGAR
jgi:abhydrolase domain-containing protein 12